MIFNHPISQRPLQKNLFVFENELFRDYLYGVRKLDGGNNDRELINMVKICKTYSIADFFFFFFFRNDGASEESSQYDIPYC